MNTTRTNQKFSGMVCYDTIDETDITKECSSVFDMIYQIINAIKSDPGDNNNTIYACICSPINKSIWCSEEFTHKTDIDESDTKAMSALFNIAYGFRGSINKISDDEYSFILKVRRRPCSIVFRVNSKSIDILSIDSYIGNKISAWIMK